MKDQSGWASGPRAAGFAIFIYLAAIGQAPPSHAMSGDQVNVSSSRDGPSQQVGERPAPHWEAKPSPWLLAALQGEPFPSSQAETPNPPPSQGSPPPQSSQPSFLLNEQTILENEIAALNRNEAMALQALAAGKHALADAQSEGNAQAQAVAQHAIDLANQELEKTLNQRADNQLRLDAVKQALAWPPSKEPVGVSTLVRGNVYKRTPEGEIAVEEGPILPGDEIVVGWNSYVEILAPDGTRLSLGEHTEFTYLGGENRSMHELIKGVVRALEIWNLKANGDIDEYRMTTSTAVSTVRGTEYLVEATGSGSTFTVLEGVVDVTPKSSSTPITLHAGQRLQVDQSGPVEGPESFDPKIIPRWWR